MYFFIFLFIVLFLFFGKDSLWQAIFDSASHIFNDGITAKTNSMIPFRNNLGMLISGGFLITVGGFGIAIRAIFYKWFLGLVGLKNIAKKTNGKYYNASDNFKMEEIFKDIDLMEKNIILDDQFSKKNELFSPFALVAILLLLVYFILQYSYLKSIS